MKKVLIFTIAVLMTFSIFAMADGGGPVFQGGKLIFNPDNDIPHFYDPNLYFGQEAIATSTAYDSTLCNTSGKVLLNSFYGVNRFNFQKSLVILAGLNVESNATSVGVSISGPAASEMPDGMNLSYDYTSKSGGIVSTVITDNPPATLELPFDSKPGNHINNHSGYLYVTSSSTVSQWNEVKNRRLMFTFTITPLNYY